MSPYFDISGDVHALCHLGGCFFYGEGVEKDETLAVAYFKKAAKKGSTLGMCCLALAFMDGKGVASDKGMAADLFKQAALKGDSNAQCCLGKMHLKGDGVAKSKDLAVQWFLKAEALGDMMATRFLQDIKSGNVQDDTPVAESTSSEKQSVEGMTVEAKNEKGDDASSAEGEAPNPFKGDVSKPQTPSKATHTPSKATHTPSVEGGRSSRGRSPAPNAPPRAGSHNNTAGHQRGSSRSSTPTRAAGEDRARSRTPTKARLNPIPLRKAEPKRSLSPHSRLNKPGWAGVICPQKSLGAREEPPPPDIRNTQSRRLDGSKFAHKN